LKVILFLKSRHFFFQQAHSFDKVVISRCEPCQKGNIVRQFKLFNPQAIILSIGDGANDIDMIRAASIGIGVEGVEGSEAVLSSDFSILSFKFLSPLLLVQGRWCAMRCALVIHTTFYKNAMMAWLQIFYGIFNGFSGSTCYDSGFYAMYNIIFTVPQQFFLCIFEQDIESSFALTIPETYIGVQQTGDLGLFDIFGWYLKSFIHSSIVFFSIYFETNCLLTNTGNTLDH
jgi:magnesium-transporting ATPase (P-type)